MVLTKSLKVLTCLISDFVFGVRRFILMAHIWQNLFRAKVLRLVPCNYISCSCSWWYRVMENSKQFTYRFLYKRNQKWINEIWFPSVHFWKTNRHFLQNACWMIDLHASCAIRLIFSFVTKDELSNLTKINFSVGSKNKFTRRKWRNER